MHVWLRRFSWTLSLKSLLGPVYMNWVSLVSRTGARFSKVLITFRARKPVLCLSSLHLKSKWMIQCNYQLTKQNLPVCELGTMLLFNRFWFKNLPSDPQSYRAFRETGPRGPFLESPGNFSGPKSNIQIEIWSIKGRVLASKLLHFVSLTDSFIMLDAKLLKPRSLL